MSNLVFSGYTFQSDLLARWFLQNTLQVQSGETGEMQFPLLDYLGNGFDFVTQTPYGSNPNFVFRKELSGIKTDLLSFDGTASLFKFKMPLDMGSKAIGVVCGKVQELGFRVLFL